MHTTCSSHSTQTIGQRDQRLNSHSALSFKLGIVLTHLESFPQNGRLAIANYLRVWEVGILPTERIDSQIPAIQGGVRTTWESCQEDASGIKPESLCEELDWPPHSTGLRRHCISGTAWTPPLKRLQPRVTNWSPLPCMSKSWSTPAGTSGVSSCCALSSAAFYHLLIQSNHEGRATISSFLQLGEWDWISQGQ